MCLVSCQSLTQSADLIGRRKHDNAVLKCGWHSKASNMLLHVVGHLINTTHHWSFRYRDCLSGNNTWASIISLLVVVEVLLDFIYGTVSEQDTNITSKELKYWNEMTEPWGLHLMLTQLIQTFEICLRFSLYSSSDVVPSALAITLFFPRKNLESLNSDLISFKKVFLMFSTEKTQRKAYLSTHSLTCQLIVCISIPDRQRLLQAGFWLLPLRRGYPCHLGLSSQSWWVTLTKRWEISITFKCHIENIGSQSDSLYSPTFDLLDLGMFAEGDWAAFLGTKKNSERGEQSFKVKLA